jgi:hypothetical protein
MGKLPITSSLKRTAFQLRSVAKQTTDPTPNASVVSQEADTTETITVPGKDTKVKKKYVGAANDACSAEYIAKNGKGACDKYEALPQEQKDAGNFDTVKGKDEEKEIIVKGEDVIADTYSKREGKVQTNFDGRQIGRATKFKNRYVRQSKIKLGRANDRMANFQKKYMKDGVFTAPKAGDKGYKKYIRLEAKQTENTNELADFESGAANQAEAVRSGKSIGSTTRRDVDRQDTAGDQTPEQRLAQVRAEKRASDAAANNIITESTGQSTQAIEAPAMGGPKGQFDVGETEEFDPTKFGQYSAPNKKRGYGMKAKSVATKKLQGAQGKLPSHLQAAIKAAPERTALKKSYFKNK